MREKRVASKDVLNCAETRVSIRAGQDMTECASSTTVVRTGHIIQRNKGYLTRNAHIADGTRHTATGIGKYQN